MIRNFLKRKDPFEFDANLKKKFLEILIKLTKIHQKKCKNYYKIIKKIKFKKTSTIEDLPFLPSSIFKEIELYSMRRKKIFKTLKSSGTSGQNVSKIFLDKKNAKMQTLVLSKIFKSILGEKRLPILFFEKNLLSTNKKLFDAKMAAILGFSIFGYDHTYVVDENSQIDFKKLNSFLRKYSKKKFIIFGFTSNIYEYLINKLNKKYLDHSLKNAILIHGGGWKKMENIKVDNSKFKNLLFTKLKIKDVINYYGMVEQAGSVYLECQKCHFFKTSIFSDVLIRDERFASIKKNDKKNKKGLLQVLSILPTSYPGHSILTEDLGEFAKKKCSCGFSGTRFLVHGRSKLSEVRGCSDV
tara:strand:+ start:1505 stop:2569 length:1065 start_codon:yes stop_codon:yes gene_type:complete